LGKQLYLQIADIYKNNGKPQVFSTDSIQQVIVEMTSNRRSNRCFGGKLYTTLRYYYGW